MRSTSTAQTANSQQQQQCDTLDLWQQFHFIHILDFSNTITSNTVSKQYTARSLLLSTLGGLHQD